jgi:hypothetical protein
VHKEHEELARRVDERLDRIETKLDKYLEALSRQEADLTWVKGYIRTSVSALIALALGVITSLISVFTEH